MAPADLPRLAASVAAASPGLEPAAVEEFLGRMDESYLDRHTPGEMALHARLAAEVGPGRSGRVHVGAVDDGRFEVVIVGLDYFGEFSMLCGLLAAHGLSIESGEVHTFRPAPAPATPPGARRRPPPSTKIVDVFRVVPRPGRGAPDAARIEEELLALLGLVGEGRADEARERLNRQLVESLESARSELARTVRPVEIEFDNQALPSWTVMRVRGRDAPAFLYALANALAMREIYVHAVRIESHGLEVRDEFEIAHRDGRKIEDAHDQDALRLAIVLIKQFTHYLPSAPDPARALRSFDQLLDRLMAGEGEALPLLRAGEGLRELAQLLGSSQFLWEDFLRRHVEHLAPLLEEWKTRPLRDRKALEEELHRRLRDAPSWEERKRRLNELKDEEMFFVDMKHALDEAVSLGDFESALADLAEAVLAQTLDLCHSRLIETHGSPRRPDGGVCPVALLGLGKFGGRELGYASDLELLVVYEEPGTTTSGLENGELFARLVQDVTETLEAREEGIFHLDLRLRPHGKKGPLASPFGLLRDYYRAGGDAHPFERQALVKLRFVAGDPGLGRRVEAFRDAYVWSDEPWDLAEALRLRERQVTELVPPGRFNVKLSRGGLVDVEYSAQYLQIQHGRAHAALRTPRTLAALSALAELGILSSAEHAALREGYVFWRRVADALRMVRGQASDLLVPDEGSEELRLLARRLGYRGRDWAEAAGALDADIDRHRLEVQAAFDRRFEARMS